MAEVRPLAIQPDRIKSTLSSLVSVSPHCPSGGTERNTSWSHQIHDQPGCTIFCKDDELGLKTEYPINIGSGFCLGVEGRCGLDIDCIGFMFTNPG